MTVTENTINPFKIPILYASEQLVAKVHSLHMKRLLFWELAGDARIKDQQQQRGRDLTAAKWSHCVPPTVTSLSTDRIWTHGEARQAKTSDITIPIILLQKITFLSRVVSIHPKQSNLSHLQYHPDEFQTTR